VIKLLRSHRHCGRSLQVRTPGFVELTHRGFSGLLPKQLLLAQHFLVNTTARILQRNGKHLSSRLKSRKVPHFQVAPSRS
jgi:hypothetical protein